MAFTAVLLTATFSSVEAVWLRTGSASGSGVREYDLFRSQFGVNREGDSLTYGERVALFQKRVETVRKHNEKKDRLWTATVNKFADYTDEEFHAMLGHRPMRRQSSPVAMFSHLQTSSFLQEVGNQAGPGAGGVSLTASADHGSGASLAATVDWRQTVQANATELARTAKDQGGCGSCWAVAAAGALEVHAAMTGAHVEPVSYEQLVDCVVNLRQCGGTGGCHGATAELALEYVKDHGIDLASNYRGYQSGGGEGHCQAPTNPALRAEGFVRLPENEGQPLLEAVAHHGPVVVSADASGWSMYSNGVFDGCGKDAITNHAILLMGYGHDAGKNKDYWLIRNSWGQYWGEEGFIRLLRHSSDEEFCGTNRKPEDGVGCAGGPSEVPVCGMCGVLADSAYPTGVTVHSM